jgi:tRNA A37 threonylcarbamoyladenosine synthetase subunit TsaC/SUA5/YrdC
MIFLLPTDTCYGLAGEFNEQDYHEIYRLKGRDFGKLLAILVADYDDLRQYIEISDEQIEFLKNYPHPWSFLGKKKSDFMLPSWMDNEKYQMLSIRVASVCLKTPEKLSFPLFLTSANLS